MVNINHETTKLMFEGTSHDFLVHKGSYDRIYYILKNKSIDWRKFASFSDGLPLIPIHGDSAIIFDKSKLIEKNHHFLKIKYEIDFLKKNKDVLEHLMENKSKEELLKKVFEGIGNFEKKLTILRATASNEDIKEIDNRQKELNEFKRRVKISPMDYFIKMFGYEKEIISLNPFNFDSEDVKFVISNSLMPKYYGVPDEFKDRFIFIEDYCNAKIVIGSPLFSWLDMKKAELDDMKIQGIGVDGELKDITEIDYFAYEHSVANPDKYFELMFNAYDVLIFVCNERGFDKLMKYIECIADKIFAEISDNLNRHPNIFYEDIQKQEKEVNDKKYIFG